MYCMGAGANANHPIAVTWRAEEEEEMMRVERKGEKGGEWYNLVRESRCGSNLRGMW